MASFRQIFFRICLIITLFVFFTGCAAIQRNPKKDISPQAHVLIQLLETQNTGLRSFKGLGSYRLINTEGNMSGRMGWACRPPDQLRVDILDYVGRPAAAIASDGKQLYARVNGESTIHKRSNIRTALRKILGTPLNAAEIIAFLGGRIPLRPHQIATVNETSDGRAVLILKKNDSLLIEKIFFKKDTGLPERVLVYHKSNRVAYEVTFGPSVQQEGVSFYKTLSFSADRGSRLDVKTTKLWASPDLPTSLFKLSGHETNRARIAAMGDKLKKGKCKLIDHE